MGIDIVKARADNVYPDGDEFLILANDDMIRARTVIICTGIPTAIL
jgi:thioredoxin reductase